MVKSYTSARATHTPNSGLSVLGANTSVVGNFQANTDLQVDGNVEGDIRCHALTQGEASEIIGNVHTDSVRIAGLVRGSINARDVVILNTARIEGDVVYETLTIEQGARLDGRLCPHMKQATSITKPAPTIARLPSVATAAE